jgi:hypothetical protein
MLYRVIYYWLPFVLAVALLGANEWWQARQRRRGAAPPPFSYGQGGVD